MRALASAHRARSLALTAADREVEALAARFAAVAGVDSSSGGIATGSAIGPSDRHGLAEGLAGTICARLDALSEPLMIVIDDVDQLADAYPAGRFLATVCLQAPPELRLVFGGRRLPSLGLGSMRGRGELLEVTAADLAFTEHETATLLKARLGGGARALAEPCWSLTTGWAAALQLIADRLERTEPDRWAATVQGIDGRRGALWRDFAGDLIGREAASARRILDVASVLRGVDPELLAGLGVPSAAAELESLQSRGLIVASGEHGIMALSPVLTDTVAEQLADADAQALRGEAMSWLEAAGRLEEALDCAASGSRREAEELIRRSGRRLVAGGHGERVAEVLHELGSGQDVELETIRAEALTASGDWDGAVELFSDIERRTAGSPPAPAIAWRHGALLYLRGDMENARTVLGAAFDERAQTSDGALVSAWLSSTLWGRGETDEARRTAEIALTQAAASASSGARAAAHAAAAMAAAASGDRERIERHNRLGLAAAREAGDAVQLARIHNNQSSKSIEDGQYRRAIQEADQAISTGATLDIFRAMATSNKAEALMHLGELEEARALLVQAIEMFDALGSLAAATPYTLLGSLDTERGNFARARVSLERGLRLAERAGDVHELARSRCGLARILADDDPDAAALQARTAAELATSLEHAPALCTLALVELHAGRPDAAAKLAREAREEAQRTDDRPSLARALELLGAASKPLDEDQLEAAADLWREVGDEAAALRTEMILAGSGGDPERVAQIREELAARGVRPELDVAGIMLAGQRPPAELSLTTLGRFAVSLAGRPIPLVNWKSRKSRDLLKLLAARRGRPLTREAAAEALWPGEPPGVLANRLSVALSTLRKVLDPERRHSADHLIASDGHSLSLRLEHIDLDVARFIEAAHSAIAQAEQGDSAVAEFVLRDAAAMYTGDFLEDDIYEDWAVECREQARLAAQDVSRLLARAASARGDDEEASRRLRLLLERDPFDADAWTALIGAQLRMRRYGEARRQHVLYARRMGELAISPVPLEGTREARP